MRNEMGYIDWDRTEEYAKSLDTYALLCAIKDAQDTLPMADAKDRETLIYTGKGPFISAGGYYRDCISVYRTELNRRRA